MRQVLRLFAEKNGKKRDVYIKADKGDLFFKLDKHEFFMTLHALHFYPYTRNVFVRRTQKLISHLLCLPVRFTQIFFYSFLV
jgi:hypothetical protein